MLPRWFRVVVAAEIAGLVAFVVLGVHVIAQGVHSAGNALGIVRPALQPAHATPPPIDGIPSLATSAGAPPPRAVLSYGAAMLSPSLLVRLNRDTGATAFGEYALLLNLEAVARDEVTHLLDTLRAGTPAGGR